MDYVYMVQIDRSLYENGYIEVTLFKNYDDAYDFYKNLIVEECDADNCWIGSQMFDEDGEVIDGYELDCDDNNSGESDVYWYAVEKDDYRCHTFIDLMKKEVN